MGNHHTLPPDPRRIVLVGKTGAGKSATGNSILGKTRFRSETGSSTSETEIHDAVVSGRKISVVDTPGLFHTILNCTQLGEEIGRSIYLSRPGPHAFLYVHPVNFSFTEQEEDVLQTLELIFGKNLHKYTIAVFTFGDLLKEKSVDAFIQKSSSLRKVVVQCGGRYHLMNNNQRKKQQVTDLLEKINRMVEENGGNHYTSDMFEKAQEYKTFKEFLQEWMIFAAGVWCEGGVLRRFFSEASIWGTVRRPVGAISAGVGAVLSFAKGSRN